MVKSPTVTITVGAAPPPPSTITQIQTVTSAGALQTGQALTVTAKAVDQFGHVMPGVTLYLWQNFAGGAFALEGSTVTDSNGIATWTVTFSSAGGYNLLVSPTNAASSVSSVASNIVPESVSAPPPPPQTVFQLVPGQKVKIPAMVANMGLHIINGPDVGAPYWSEVLIIGGIGRTVTVGGLQVAWSDVNQTSLIGTGAGYRVVDSYQQDALGKEIFLAQKVGNDGAVYVTATVDGNYLTLTFTDSLNNVLYTISGIRPGNQYDQYGKYWSWGGGISVNIIDMDQWAAWAPSYSATYFGQVTPASYGSYKVIAGTIQLVLPTPTLTITDKGIDPLAPGAHIIHVGFVDSSSGALLQAVANPLAFGFTSGGSTPYQYHITNGSGDFDITGSGSIFAFVGILPATSNTIVSNSVTI